jgi:MFS family permease
VALLWFVGGSAYLTRTMLTTMRGSVLHDIPMTEAQFGLLTSVFLWFYASVGPLGGFIGDRFSRRWVILVSLLAWSAITILTAYARTFPQFLVLRALLGLGQACYIPTGVALITDFHRGPTRAFATGLNLTGMICGSIVGSSCGWIADRYGWHAAYLAAGLGSLGLVALNYFFLRDAPREHTLTRAAEPKEAGATGQEVRFLAAVRSLARPGPFYLLIASMAVQGAVSWIIIAWMPTVMGERFKLGQGAAGTTALGMLYVFQASGLLLGGIWSDRWALSNPRARILLPAFAIMLAAPIFWLTGWSHLIVFTLASLGAYGLSMGFMGANQMAIVCLVVDARYRATAVGVMNAGTAIAGGLAIYGLGALRDAGIGTNSILMVAGLGVFLCGFLLWLIRFALPREDHA